MLKTVLDRIRRLRADRTLPPEAQKAAVRDTERGPGSDPGIHASVDAALDWLARAQDLSASSDGGFARHYSLISGWAPSYPETTGYIVPTLLTCARRFDAPDWATRARRALDWLVSIQLPDGGFQGGVIGTEPVVPVTFNTGQILMGLAAGHQLDGRTADSMHAAARWLVATQDDDGGWRRHPTPFAAPGEKAYETHVAWGLLEAARASGNDEYGRAALRNVDWAIRKQTANGWFRDCCLTAPLTPLTHTLGYVLRGVIEGARYSDRDDLLDAARLSARGLLGALRDDGFLPGRLDGAWKGTVAWSCLTGTVQIAHCWMLLYQVTAEEEFLDAARRANRYVRRTIDLEGSDGTRGGIRGSFPVSGGYGPYEYLNWAAKFFIDSNLLEADLTGA